MSMKLSVLSSYTNREISEITKLLTESFPGNSQVLEQLFSSMLSDHPSLKTLVVKNESLEIVSVMFLIEGTFDIGYKSMTYCNMSFFATDPNYRKGTATKLIVDYVTTVIQVDFDVVFGFPRHIMMGYWSRYGFKESTNSHCKSLQLPNNRSSTRSDFSIREASLADISSLTRIYASASAARAMNFTRSESKWRYILEFCKIEGIEVNIASNQSGQHIGYICNRNGLILEMAYLQQYCVDLLSLASLSLGNQVDIKISLRGVIPGVCDDELKIAIDELAEVSSVEDLWDFMYYSKNNYLLEFLGATEGEHSANFNHGIDSKLAPIYSNFTVLDQI
jgi:hypothetical protein